MSDEPLVEIEVMVNFEGLRRGQTGQVELSPRIEALARRGYLKLLGHVNPSPLAPVAPAPPAPVPGPTRAPRPSRAKRKPPETPTEVDTDGDSTGASGD